MTAPALAATPSSSAPERPAVPNVPRTVAQLALLAVHIGVVIGLDRLYLGRGYVGPLVAFVLVAHALAFAGRQWSLPAPLMAVVAVAGAAVTAAWTLFPSTRAFGALPSAATWHEAVASLRAARPAFAEVVAPTAPIDGFQLAAGLALSAAVWFADWTAFRLRTTVEAVAPAAVLFVFAALLGSGQHQWSATMWFVVPTLVFVAAQRASRTARQGAWLGTSPARGPVAVLRSAGAVVAVAVLAGVVVGPRIPGATSEPVVQWRRSGGNDGTRITVSPLVELRKRLVDQRDVEAFTVRTTRPAYWRLTSLDRFDGQIWSSGGSFRSAGDKLPTDQPRQLGSKEITQSVSIRALSAIWVPVAYEATNLPRSSEPLQWDRESGTLIVDRSQISSNGLTYEAVSRVPEFDPTVLGRADAPDADDIVDRYRAVPDGFPDVAERQARNVTAGATNRYEQARELQDWFRTTFTYSLSTSAGHSDDALVDFLQSREGYCEQFAGAYAAMARSLGMPSRVAVGFTPGDLDPDEPDTYHVLGRHAHAWPEVWFQDVGWVPFEPTPGRGMPGAERFTGVAPAQDDAGQPAAAGPTTTTAATPGSTTPAGAPATATTTPTTIPPPAELTTSTDEGGARSGVSPWTTGALVLSGATVLAAAAWTVRRWQLSRLQPEHPVLRAWAHALVPVRRVTGERPAPAETHIEFARRLRRPLGDASSPLLALADVVSATAWSSAAATSDQVGDAERLAGEVRSDLADQTPSWWHRFRPGPPTRQARSSA